MWPQCEFNITQLMQDKSLLPGQAINLFFNSAAATGGVYPRQNGVGTVSFRDLTALKTEIFTCPREEGHPLLGAKHFEFERWYEIVRLVDSKVHLRDTLEARDVLVKILLLLPRPGIKRPRRSHT
jgi:hypothetical protein